MKRNAGSFIKVIKNSNAKFYIPIKVRNELNLQNGELVEVSIKRVKTVFDNVR